MRHGSPIVNDRSSPIVGLGILILTAFGSSVSCFQIPHFSSSSINSRWNANLEFKSSALQRRASIQSSSRIHNDNYNYRNNRNNCQNALCTSSALQLSVRDLPKAAVHTYVDYASRLWRETDPKERKKLNGVPSIRAIKRVQDLIENDEFDFEKSQASDDSEQYRKAKKSLLEGCHLMLEYLQDHPDENDVIDVDKPELVARLEDIAPIASDQSTPVKKKKKQRSIMFGAAMGGVVAAWVFSGNYIFTGLFAAMTVLGQLEYYRMVMNAGIYPARRISVLGAAAMFVTALLAPNLHQICLPVFSTWAMIWFLTMRRKISTISEISSTLTGITYLGYIPSFWVRIRLIGGGREPTKLAPLVKPMLDFLASLGNKSAIPAFVPKSIHLPITTGAIFIFWSWLCIAFSDVGAYFTGINFGKTKLKKISPAAGIASPNKTVEGVIGGCAVSAALATFGAWVMNWPFWYISGPFHGIMLAFLGLIGDLTASMIKRDAGIKDFGDLLPEHGGIMDRVDSFIFTAPYGWVMLSYVLPWLKTFARA
mmetsp:Transcript_7641/g.9795  ORF Transcript_7641/g.9795 Transcript_7641/m.9795 type:complete len:538 (+) Transcript_7641:148-1761(+)|eukprot:CAMPEP_0116064692 /NCGR_PEP_ID=MMETSP0322-20121206/9274_1 /TAXON_ID=163516 /ORGANISM="Leptocylindrus danicus var. apora, Strain B651" /LENGTH=537 /DNA_ID=CAMNT_0003550775 /DNA_START=119 /DNA_END=1732 /DNA_ORIENTATION=+